MRVLVCNERFLFRYGLDRVLIIVGQDLAKRGHGVSVMGNRFDRTVVEQFADHIHEVPSGSPYIDASEFTANWLRSNWDTLFQSDAVPDIALLGGWPFFAAIPVFREHGVRVVFVDYGVVPLDGYSGGHREVLERIIGLRRKYLPQADLVIAGSEFLARTQSRPDVGHSVQVSIILAGADHMQASIWQAGVLGPIASMRQLPISQIVEYRVLVLGRWEPGCYKNSESAFQVLQRVRSAGLEMRLLILGDESTVDVPAEYKSRVTLLGFPDDSELQSIMLDCDAGISLSRWEGFNLPLAEMQWLGRSVFVLDAGAHPEVVAHPWNLCDSIEDMSLRLIRTLQGEGPSDSDWNEAIERFRGKFTWNRAVDNYEALLVTCAMPAHQKSVIAIDVTNACLDTANSGVIRVTRRLSRELQAHCTPIFIVWNDTQQTYVLPTRDEYGLLSSFNGPIVPLDAPCSLNGRPTIWDPNEYIEPNQPAWLLLTETVLEVRGHRVRRFARDHDLSVAAIFYDAIPILRPDLVKDVLIRENHAQYMRGLAEVDLVLPISEFSAACLHDFWERSGLAGTSVVAQPLPGEFAQSPRQTNAYTQRDRVDVLFVSTLEPRKNHKVVISAMKQLAHRCPDLDWTLTMVGNRYAGSDDVVQLVLDECARDPRMRWLGVVDDRILAEAYAACSFTVYASGIEGFGLPILESLWMGKPCICHQEGVMAELAAAGGCLLADTTDVSALSAAIEQLATDGSLCSELALAAGVRPIRTWAQYGHGVWTELQTKLRGDSMTESESRSLPTLNWTSTDYTVALYDGCLTAEWQMNDSERLGLMAVLSRLRPSCAIEVGTYKGGSLSLMAQYAHCVYSIDIDPEIPKRFSGIKNARFLTGSSPVVLPLLLKELAASGMAVQFVLLDGDHSADGVRMDIETLLDYIPTQPLVVMMHDAFNPECRRGMTEANWNRSPYVHHVDLDFIPGRVIEHGGGGDGQMWGGLGLAYFSPAKREGQLQLRNSLEKAFSRARQSMAA